MTEKPHRAHRIRIEIETDTLNEMIERIREEATRLVEGGRGHVYGGSTCGGFSCYEHDPDMTPDKYAEENEKYVVGLKGGETQGPSE